MRATRRWARLWTGLAVSAVTVTAVAGCTDATDAYCDRLAADADLRALTTSIENGDLESARSAADEFRRLADDAPSEIRADMREIATGITGIVELLEQERRETSVSDDTFGSETETEQLRNRLNDRFDDLDRRSLRVETWASTNCGLDLS